MWKLLRCVCVAGAAVGIASTALAGELTVRIADGRATVIARDVPLRQILAEWARVGNTQVVNADKMTSGPLTVELVDMPEKDALDILLRSAAGYMAAPRPEHVTGASLYDRVIILASSKPPPPTAVMPPQPFGGNRPLVQQTLPPQGQPGPQGQPQPQPEDDNQPDDQGPMPPPGMMPGVPFPGGPGTDPNQVPAEQAAPITSPRPGQLPPPPQPTPGNPYGIRPGAGPAAPGTVPGRPRTPPDDQ